MVTNCILRDYSCSDFLAFGTDVPFFPVRLQILHFGRRGGCDARTVFDRLGTTHIAPLLMADPGSEVVKPFAGHSTKAAVIALGLRI